MKFWRIAIAATGIIAVLMIVGVVVLHLPQIKDRVANRLATIIAEKTCLEVETADFDYRLWPARLDITSIVVSDSSGRMVTIKKIAASWSWFELLGQTPQLKQLAIEGLEANVLELPVPCPNSPGDNSVDPWSAFSVYELTVDGARFDGTSSEIAFRAEELRAHASLIDRQLRLRAAAEVLQIDRDDRALRVGPLEIELDGSPDGTDLRTLRISEGPIQLIASGSGDERGKTASAKFSGSIDLVEILNWWDPELATALNPHGPLEYVGDLTWDIHSGFNGGVQLAGEPVRLAGFTFDQIQTTFGKDQMTARASDPSWGRAHLVLSQDRSVKVEAWLQDAILTPALSLSSMQLPQGMPSDIKLTGNLLVHALFPLKIEQLTGTADIEARWQGGQARFKGRADNGIVVDNLSSEIFGTDIEMSGMVNADGNIDLESSIEIPDPGDSTAQLMAYLPDAMESAVGGGPIRADLKLDGTITEPEIDCGLHWERPNIVGNTLESVNVHVRGTLDQIDWTGTIFARGVRAAAAGTATPRASSISGTWQLDVDDLSAVHHSIAPIEELAMTGSITGAGKVFVESDTWGASAQLKGNDITADFLEIPSLVLEIEADNNSLVIQSATAEFLGGTIEGTGDLRPSSTNGELSASIQWSDLDPSQMTDMIPEIAQGRISGQLRVSGPLLDPVGEAMISWKPDSTTSFLQSGFLQAHLNDGIVRISSDQLHTASGALHLRADLPLGELARPAGLWGSAPLGPWKLSLEGHDLNLAPIFNTLNRPDLNPAGNCSLNFTASWTPDQGGLPQAHLEVFDLEARIAGREFATRKPIRLALDDRGVIAADVDVQGDITQIAASGSFDLMSSEIDLSIDGSLDPGMAALAPVPVTIVAPIRFNGQVRGPADAWIGHLTLNHEDGSIRISEPPMVISDSTLEIQWLDGILEIDGGSAEINRGTVYFGGAWDPKSGQGIVAEIEDVTTLLPGGIITRWDGLLALEPATDLVAYLIGDLNLKYGVWDYPFDLGAALRGEDTSPTSGPDDLMHRIGLDLEIRGGGGIAVNNNLGRFGVRWNVLEVGGNAGDPRIIGDLNLLPGGFLSAAGHPIAIKRGLIQFTGDPLTDPLVEIIPEEQAGTTSGELGDLGAESLNQASNIAAAGLASGLGAVFGLENTTIRPEEIALETDDDTSTNFSIGQQLSHNTAIFLTTDLHNSQKRTTLLQLWRLASLPGLTIQAQTRTDPGEADIKLLQRFSWGGTLATDDQPRLHKIRLEGDWPLSKRKLRKATALVRDQPWDPFFLFLGDIRLERKLAGQGWPEARIESRVEGTAQRPIAVFTCSPGRKVEFSFEGDEIGKELRERLLPLYHFPPLETTTLTEMKRMISRRLWANGFPKAEVDIDSDGEGQVVVRVDKGQPILLTGPFLEGVPDEATPALLKLLSQPGELAQISRDSERAGRVVRRSLATRGYRDVVSVESWISTTVPGEAEVHLRVDPGHRARAVRFEMVGTDPLGLTDAEDFPIYQDMVLDRGVIDQAVASLRRAYRREGYTDAKVRSQIFETDEDQWAILLILDSGNTSLVDRIEITGRRHLSESILLDGLDVEPGKLFRLNDLDESVSRLVTFEPIERVTASTRPDGAQVIVDLDIIEKARWTAEFGGGWNSDRGITARVGATDHNLLGHGLSLGIRGRWENEFLQGRVIVGLPPPPGGRFSAGFNASYTEDVLPAEIEGDLVIREEIREATVEGRYRLGPGLWTRGYYRFTRTRSYEDEPFDPDFPFDTTIDVAVLGSQIITDRLDNPFDPRHGFYLAFDLSWADELLGSDKENIRGLLTGSLASEPRTGWTWFQSLRIGAAKPFNGALDRNSRFFAGGPASIRGFKLDSVGPVETIGGTTIYAGGEALFVLNEELRFPLWQSLRGAAFVDAGQVWETWSNADFDLSVGAGFGLRWSTPIGPLWVDAAWPVANPGLNSGARYSFGIGRTF